MIQLKEDHVFAILGDDGGVRGGREGVYRFGTRFLSAYSWHIPEAMLLTTQSDRGDRLWQHWSLVNAHKTQQVGIRRTLRLTPSGFLDVLELAHTGTETVDIDLHLSVDGDFNDVMAIGIGRTQGLTAPPEMTTASGETRIRHVAADGVVSEMILTFPAESPEPRWSLRLAPGETHRIAIAAELRSGIEAECGETRLPTREVWRAQFPVRLHQRDAGRVLNQAVEDLRTLLLSMPEGAYPAAGVPWFVTPFGRDAIITAMMLAPWTTDTSAVVLEFLGGRQGKVANSFREEEPGKILHEVRYGELSRTDRIPFGRYYGSVDSTPLYLMLLAEHVRWSGDTGAIERLAPYWQPALTWLEACQDLDAGLVTFTPSGSGLTVQSWKDSGDSMNHADGTPAEPPLAVAEVQGYAYAAFLGAAGFFHRLGDDAKAAELTRRAVRLRERFHEAFWLDDINCYAMALDRHGGPLRVLSSDSGHLLWCGIVPDEVAPRLVATLMGDRLWSGWGIRTLAAGERRYNPVSYHNGAVWPHDTALLAGGLARYGFTAELRTVAEALFALADSQPDRRLPELVSGFPREDGGAPVPYTHACRPQAWAAASLPYLVALLWNRKPGDPGAPDMDVLPGDYHAGACR